MTDKGVMKVLKADITGASLKFDEPMKEHTSLHMGGPAEIYIIPQDEESLSGALAVLNRAGLPPLPLGGGTNLLVKTEGIAGAVISLADIRMLDVMHDDAGQKVIYAGAGLPLQELVRFAAREGLSGIEGLAGIPGCVGGALSGNSGAFGYEMKDKVHSISLMDSKGSRLAIGKDEIDFGYRRAGLPEGSVVVGVELGLEKDTPETVAARVRDFLKEKRARQPIGQRSAGCVFKNPESAPAGKLIDEAGCKGMAVGDIEVSDVHANFFINRGSGTADDFLKLMDIVAKRVKNAFGIALEPEIRIVGR
jgi:UDP-N-acetylmuramate dehydrogenase